MPHSKRAVAATAAVVAANAAGVAANAVAVVAATEAGAAATVAAAVATATVDCAGEHYHRWGNRDNPEDSRQLDIELLADVVAWPEPKPGRRQTSA